MTTIIAGEFATMAATESVAAALRDADFDADSISRHAGAMVAVRAKSTMSANRAIGVLRAHGARQIEQAEGRWENGKWLDFDPRVPPHVVNQATPERVDRASVNR